MNAAEFASAVMLRLDSLPASLSAHDGKPTSIPAGNYCYVVFDGGLGRRVNLSFTSRLDHTAYIVCVGFDRNGARFVVDAVRRLLLDHRLDGNHPLTELASGQEITDGPIGDERTSITLTYRLVARSNR